jgi:hypothetical protein
LRFHEFVSTIDSHEFVSTIDSIVLHIAPVAHIKFLKHWKLAGEPALLRVNEMDVRMIGIGEMSLPVEGELCSVSEG